MKTLKVLTIVAITGLVGTVAANACPASFGDKKAMCEKQNKCQKKKKHNRGEMREIYQKLNLSPEQQSAMQEYRKSMREQRQAKRAQMQGERGIEGMSKFVSVNGFDKEAFIAEATQRSQERIEMHANMFEKKINILTEEQRAKLISLIQEKQK
jgi:Spy/CpxP family protein refolding chaperone